MRVTIRVRPGARKPEVGGTHDGALVVKVAAVPEGGRATQAALVALAEALGVPRRDVTLVTGMTSRTKIVEIPEESAPVYEALTHLP
ncbi:DUF167 domain-containing protein [Aeromicrobium terrae]|uniref:UPF0235 protein FHP06_08210 n=1 Tax=Aeromicrobium terrae TaxID=2498846 RepID=A0A5C8NJJ3_9ACTN|nr:DUF167 domain-containing protein [Aeromicrobium terrae]TXL61402.1 DUF167 domain-containing protein [Aeromicrobium terrae]